MNNEEKRDEYLRNNPARESVLSKMFNDNEKVEKKKQIKEEDWNQYLGYENT